MIQLVLSTIVDSGFQAIGWAVLKGVTLGRYRGLRPEDIHVEGILGFAAFALLSYGVYQVIF